MIAREPVTDALVVALATTGSPVGDHKAPDLSALQLDNRVPYGIVYGIPGGMTWGPPLVDPDQCAWMVWQVTVVGWRRDSVEALADRFRAAVLGRGATGAFTVPITVVGGASVVKARDVDALGAPEPAGELVTVADRYRLALVPA